MDRDTYVSSGSDATLKILTEASQVSGIQTPIDAQKSYEQCSRTYDGNDKPITIICQSNPPHIRDKISQQVKLNVVRGSNEYNQRFKTNVNCLLLPSCRVFNQMYKEMYCAWEDKISQTTRVQDQTTKASTSTNSSQSSEREDIVRNTASNYCEYKDFLMSYDPNKSLYIFYSGSYSLNSGYSWCRICSEALPIIEQAIKRIHRSIFLIAFVGCQEDWEDKRNPYRIDKRLNLKVLPTILKYQTPRRLEGTYCMKPELLELLFEDDADYY